jgi:hypothetical protein
VSGLAHPVNFFLTAIRNALPLCERLRRPLFPLVGKINIEAAGLAMLCFGVVYGQGRVFKRGQVWWIAYFDGKGRELRESSRSHNKDVAVQLLRSRLASPSQSTAEHTFEDMAALYLQEHRLRGPRSYDWAEDRIDHLRKVFAGVRIVRITPGDMQRYRSLRLEEGASAGTVNRDLGALGRMLTLAIQQGWLQHKPRLARLQEADPRQGFVEHSQ